jgi:hypothetical protein
MKKKQNIYQIILIVFIFIFLGIILCKKITPQFTEAFQIQTTTKSRIAIATMMRNPVDLPLWLKYHRELGVVRFYIRVEDTPSCVEYLKDVKDVVLEVGKSDKSGNNYSSVIPRQVKYVNTALKQALQSNDIDWLYHIDSDELLDGDIYIVDKIPKNIMTLKLENAEAIYDENNETCFSAVNFLKCSQGAPCKSYVNGKSAGRVVSGVGLAGCHDFAFNNVINGDFQYKVSFDVLKVLHFESCSFGGWVEKFHHMSKKDKGDMPFQYYKESIETTKNAFELYKNIKMPPISNFDKKQIYVK